MVLANRPWLLVPGLKSALVAALATGAVATINSTVWLLAGSLSWWRLIVATVASVALVVAWLVIDGELWDRPDDDSAEARERSRLYNASTLLTLTAGVLICYLALYVVNLVWALFILDPAVMGSYLQASLGYGDLFVLAWFVASAATVGGGWDRPGVGRGDPCGRLLQARGGTPRPARTGTDPELNSGFGAELVGAKPIPIEERKRPHEADEYDHGAPDPGGAVRLLAQLEPAAHFMTHLDEVAMTGDRPQPLAGEAPFGQHGRVGRRNHPGRAR